MEFKILPPSFTIRKQQSGIVFPSWAMAATILAAVVIKYNYGDETVRKASVILHKSALWSTTLS